MASVVRNGVTMTDEEISDSMYAGIRRAQDIAFCRDWSLFKKLDISDNPFGLSKKKLVEKAMAANGYSEDVEPDYPGEPVPEYDDIELTMASPASPQSLASFYFSNPNTFLSGGSASPSGWSE
jgi:hypothetical protein